MNDIQTAAWESEPRRIRIYDEAGFDGMRKAGRLAAETLDMITPHVVPGVTTGELDALCHAFILDHGAVPAPLDYRGYPKSVCIRSEEHTSELQSLMRISYAVFCLKKKNKQHT